MEEKSKVSIIVPIYNSEKTIERCIKSLISQTYKNIEIILIDDGSNDDSKRICQRYLNLDNIKYNYKKNGGVSSARNIGIEKATGNYIVFVDSDDTIENNLIELMVEKKKNNPDALIGCSVNVYQNNTVKSQLRAEKYSRNEFIIEILNNRINGFSCGFLFEKCKINKFNSSIHYMEDTLFLMEYLKNENKVMFCNSYYNYIINESSITKSNLVEKVKNNVISINNSLSFIEELLVSYGLSVDLHELIINKKSKVIESELTKLNSSKKIIQISEEIEIKDIIEVIVKDGTRLKYKFFFKIVLSKKYIFLKFYLLLRKLLKVLKRSCS